MLLLLLQTRTLEQEILRQTFPCRLAMAVKECRTRGRQEPTSNLSSIASNVGNESFRNRRRDSSDMFAVSAVRESPSADTA